MSNLWFISDTHFSHDNILTFTDKNGDLIRPMFDSADEMDEVMIERWNSVVKTGDKIYHLGDVSFNKTKMAKIMPRLNGTKRLILGNHDTFDMKFYRQYFQKIRASWRGLGHGIVFSHHPLHMSPIEKGFYVNVHGHIHQNRINDPRYVNICVEQTDYYPVHADVLIEHAKEVY